MTPTPKNLRFFGDPGKRRAPAAFYSALVLAYLGFLLYFLTLRPGGSSENPAVIWALTGFASGGMMMMAIYALTLYLFRRGEKAVLYFALYCIGSGARFLMMDGSLTLMELARGLDYNVLACIRYVATGLQVVGYISFIFEVFAEPKHKRRLPYLNAALLLLSALAAAIAASGADAIQLANLSLLLITVISIGYGIFLVARPANLRGNKLNLLYLATLTLYAVNPFLTLFLRDIWPHTNIISSTVFVIAHVVLLSDRYARAIRDVEETNENLERIVDERTKDLWNAGNAMKELVGNISHDLKTPLTVLSVNLQSLSKRVQASSDAENQRHVEVAYNKCLDLQRLIQNMFEASRIETGQALYERKWASLRGLLIQAREKYAAFLEGEGLFLDIKYNKDAEIIVDPQKIWSVFDNIIYNAVRYTEKGGTIFITAKADDSAVDVAVTDTGCGIEAEHLSRIFERFYKVSPGRGAYGVPTKPDGFVGRRAAAERADFRRPAPEGAKWSPPRGGDSGLGLYIVKSVMEGIGGSVMAQSEPGKGTSVILTFPRGM